MMTTEPQTSRADRSHAAPERGTSVLVRRRRTPTLGLWVVVSLLLGALAGIVVALLSGVPDISTALYFAATGVFFVGLPIAAVFGIVDGIRAGRAERRRGATARR